MLSGSDISHEGVGVPTIQSLAHDARIHYDELPFLNGHQSTSPNAQQSPKTSPLLGNGSIPTQLQVSPAFLLKLKRVYRKRRRVVDKRVDLNTKKRDCAYARRHELDAHEAFDRAAEHIMTQASQNTALHAEFRALHSAWEKLQESHAHLEMREEQVRFAEKAVVAREDELQEEESSFYSGLQKVNGMVSYSFPEQLPSESGSSASTHSGGVRLPPLLRQYYDLSQQASFLRGRLQEFQAEHREHVEKRKVNKELNRPVVPSEHAFLEDYFETLTAMYREYHTAKHQAAELKSRCRQLNIDIEDGEDALSDLAALVAPVAVERKLIHFVAINKSQYKGIDPLEVLLFGYTDTTARVNSWLTGVHESRPYDKSETQIHYEPAPPKYNSVEQDTDNIIAAASPSLPSTGPAAQDDYSFGAPSDNQFGIPFLLRETNFPGEAPKHRYSDPALFQTSLDTFHVPCLSRRRPRSIQ